MRHRKYTFKIGRTGSHRRAMMANMVCSLIEEGRVKTTFTKGKQLRRFTDRMITLGKAGTLAARRRAASKLNQPRAVQILFDDVAPKMADRNGGYTRVLKLGQRQGDAAEMCLVELVTEPVQPKVEKITPDAETSTPPAVESEPSNVIADDETQVEDESTDDSADDGEAAKDEEQSEEEEKSE